MPYKINKPATRPHVAAFMLSVDLAQGDGARARKIRDLPLFQVALHGQVALRPEPRGKHLERKRHG